jgi:hypothetical protein
MRRPTLLLALVGASLAQRMVMPWMCLEDCGNSAKEIAEQVSNLTAPGAPFTHASPEDWDLCVNGTICKNSKRSSVSRLLAAAGLGVHAMIVSWNLDAIRAAFAAPAAFIASVENQLLAAEPAVTGVNLDLEPHGSNPPVGPVPTAADAAAYAAFLNVFADAMHARSPRIEVSIDIATWTKFWDYSLLNTTRVDYICDMESYNADIGFFEKQVDFARAQISHDKYVVGLATTHESGPQSGKPFNVTELQWRFDFLKARGLQKVAIWDTPIPDLWLPFLAAV